MFNLTEEQAEELARLHRLERHKELVKQLEEEEKKKWLTGKSSF